MRYKFIIAIYSSLILGMSVVPRNIGGDKESSNQTLQQVKDLLKGEWKATYDESNQGNFVLWKFDGTDFQEGSTKPGELITSQTPKSVYFVGNSCATSNQTNNLSLSPNKFYLTLLESNRCFEITSIDSVYLEVLYDGTGNFISFKRQ